MPTIHALEQEGCPRSQDLARSRSNEYLTQSIVFAAAFHHVIGHPKLIRVQDAMSTCAAGERSETNNQEQHQEVSLHSIRKSCCFRTFLSLENFLRCWKSLSVAGRVSPFLEKIYPFLERVSAFLENRTRLRQQVDGDLASCPQVVVQIVMKMASKLDANYRIQLNGSEDIFCLHLSPCL